MSNGLKIAAILLAISAVSQAEIIGVALGTYAPPGKLGDYGMIPFPSDPRPIYTDVTFVEGPTGDIEFDFPLSHRRIGDGWMTWPHGYHGDVYYTNYRDEVTVTLPPDTGAFILYAELNSGHMDLTATANDGTSVTQWSTWSYGAVGFGFYTDGATDLTSITVSTYRDFAIGEFLIAPIPEPATPSFLVLCGLLSTKRPR